MAEAHNDNIVDLFIKSETEVKITLRFLPQEFAFNDRGPGVLIVVLE